MKRWIIIGASISGVIPLAVGKMAPHWTRF